jgi:cytochrome c-type biogenesis protein CcmE
LQAGGLEVSSSVREEPESERRRKGAFMRLVIVALVFLAAVGVLVGVGLFSNSITTIEYGLLLERKDRYEGETLIIPNTRVISISSRFPLDFVVAADGYEDTPMRVIGDASPPENFEPKGRVVLRGTFDRAKREFSATMVTTQCPSRYDTEERYLQLKNEKEKQAEVGASTTVDPLRVGGESAPSSPAAAN